MSPLQSPLLLLACCAPIHALHPWSPATMSPCDAADPSQQFEQQEQARGATGDAVVVIQDRPTGRCLAVKNCRFYKPTDTYTSGEVVLDSCSSPCAHWTVVPDPAFPGTGKSVYYLAGSATKENPYFSLNQIGTPPGMEQVGGVPSTKWDKFKTPFVVAYGVDVIAQTLNNQWTFTQTTGLLKVTASVDFSAASVCKDHPDNCCLASTPCVWPCSRLSDGWWFIIVVIGGAGLYLAGGLLYSHRVLGKTPAVHGVLAMLPHQTHWQALAGLVRDGQTFTVKNAMGFKSSSGGDQDVLLRREGAVPATPNLLLGHEAPAEKLERGKKDKGLRKKKKKDRSPGRASGAIQESAASAGAATRSSTSVDGDIPPLASNEPVKAVATSAGGGGRWVRVPQ